MKYNAIWSGWISKFNVPKSTSPETVSNTFPITSSESISGTLSVISNMRKAAMPDSDKYFRFESVVDRDLRSNRLNQLQMKS